MTTRVDQGSHPQTLRTCTVFCARDPFKAFSMTLVYSLVRAAVFSVTLDVVYDLVITVRNRKAHSLDPIATGGLANRRRRATFCSVDKLSMAVPRRDLGAELRANVMAAGTGFVNSSSYSIVAVHTTVACPVQKYNEPWMLSSLGED